MRLILSCCLLTLIAGCMARSVEPAFFHSEGLTQAKVLKPWGDLQHLAVADGLFIAGQPDRAALERARSNGVTAVVNLRAADESDLPEHEWVKELALNYYQVPLHVDGEGIDMNTVQAVNEVMDGLKGQSVLLHCASGNRAAAWLALHLVQQHDQSIEDAITQAKPAGLNKPFLIESVKAVVQ